MALSLTTTPHVQLSACGYAVGSPHRFLGVAIIALIFLSNICSCLFLFNSWIRSGFSVAVWWTVSAPLFCCGSLRVMSVLLLSSDTVAVAWLGLRLFQTGPQPRGNYCRACLHLGAFPSLIGLAVLRLGGQYHSHLSYSRPCSVWQINWSVAEDT